MTSQMNSPKNFSRTNISITKTPSERKKRKYFPTLSEACITLVSTPEKDVIKNFKSIFLVNVGGQIPKY